MKGTLKNNLMRKPLRKIAGAALAMLMVFTLTPAMAHADTMQPGDYHVVTNLNVSGLGMLSRVTGTLNVDNTISAPTAKPVADVSNQYTGHIVSSVEAADLFEGSYQLYLDDIKGRGTPGLYWENIVMFDKDGNFPVAQYTVQFPSNFTVDADNITFSENTATISLITKEYIQATNSVVFTFRLGNWNDYKGFFELVASERGQSGHLINIDIPYTADGTNAPAHFLGTVTGSGICQLYKHGKFPLIRPIVDIEITETCLNVAR